MVSLSQYFSPLFLLFIFILYLLYFCYFTCIFISVTTYDESTMSAEYLSQQRMETSMSKLTPDRADPKALQWLFLSSG